MGEVEAEVTAALAAAEGELARNGLKQRALELQVRAGRFSSLQCTGVIFAAAMQRDCGNMWRVSKNVTKKMRPA